MAVFRPFIRFPLEIRARVWELTVEQRTVDVGYVTQWEHSSGRVRLHVVSSTPLPAVLQSCREARNQGLYQQAFREGRSPRYLWVNFKVDVISIGHTDFDYLEPERLLIRRIIFERENDETFLYLTRLDLEKFDRLEEIQVVCVDGLLMWQEAWEMVDWPCPKEMVKFIDKETGQEASGWDIDKMWENIVGPPPEDSEPEGSE